MHWTVEPATPQEIENWRHNVYWYEFRTKKLCLEERNNGMVEVAHTEVMRAWTLNSCLGSPCCPNEWLLRCDDQSSLFFGSWDFLSQWDQTNHTYIRFPGRNLTVRRWPITHRVISADCTGEPLHYPVWTLKLDRAINKILEENGLVDYLRCQEIPTGYEKEIREALPIDNSSANGI